MIWFRLALATRKSRTWSSPVSSFVGEVIQKKLDLAVHPRGAQLIGLNVDLCIEGVAVHRDRRTPLLSVIAGPMGRSRRAGKPEALREKFGGLL
jgi:hypothetical protein